MSENSQSGSVTVRFSNVNLRALNERLGNIGSVPLDRAIIHMLELAFEPEFDPHSGEVIEPAVEATFEVIA